MRHRQLSLGIALAACLVCVARTDAQELLPTPPAESQAAPSQHAYARPAYQPYWLDSGDDPRIAPYSGHTNQAHRSPTFRWGWFGAEHHYPRVHWHNTYVDDRIRWSTQRRY